VTGLELRPARYTTTGAIWTASPAAVFPAIGDH
jgi:hypothetical protein